MSKTTVAVTPVPIGVAASFEEPTMFRIIACVVLFAFAFASVARAEDDRANLPGTRENFKVNDRPAFVIKPARPAGVDGERPWVLYAITLIDGYPNQRDEGWMLERILGAGIAVAGVDVGESYGSPEGRAAFTALYEQMTKQRGYSARPVLLARSRGGLQVYNWAVEHAHSVAAIAGIYPVGDLRTYPGLVKAAPAYGMTPAELEEKLAEHNPIDRIKPLAEAKVPIYHISGDDDRVVPLERNSAELARRYAAMGGPMKVHVFEGQGHSLWRGFFTHQPLVDFIIRYAKPGAE